MSSTRYTARRQEPEARHERRALVDALRAAAHEAVTDGFAVFPLRPHGKSSAIKRWELRATRDRELVQHWWRSRPYNIGIATGPSHLVVVDLDVVGPDEVAPEPWTGLRTGHDVLQRIATQAGHAIPDTRIVITPSGGRHLYFRALAGSTLRNTAGQWAGTSIPAAPAVTSSPRAPRCPPAATNLPTAAQQQNCRSG